MKKKVAKKPAVGVTVPTQFRLKADSLAMLDSILSEHGLVTRTDAVRYLIHQEGKRILNKSQNNN